MTKTHDNGFKYSSTCIVNYTITCFKKHDGKVGPRPWTCDPQEHCTEFIFWSYCKATLNYDEKIKLTLEVPCIQWPPGRPEVLY